MPSAGACAAPSACAWCCAATAFLRTRSLIVSTAAAAERDAPATSLRRACLLTGPTAEAGADTPSLELHASCSGAVGGGGSGRFRHCAGFGDCEGGVESDLTDSSPVLGGVGSREGCVGTCTTRTGGDGCRSTPCGCDTAAGCPGASSFGALLVGNRSAAASATACHRGFRSLSAATGASAAAWPAGRAAPAQSP
eukprot:6212158-Pleurochrysis_carterae.AAC.1